MPQKIILTDIQTHADLAKAEDAAHTSGDYGLMLLAVRKDTAAALADTDGKYIPLIADSIGRLYISPLQAGTSDIGKIGHNISGISDGRKEVATAGTRVALVASSTPAKIVIITAETDNTEYIVVGGATVVAALATRQGTTLNAGDSITLEIDNLADVYLDATVNTEGVTFVYLT